MKKTYIRPETEYLNTKMESLLSATSPRETTGGGPTGTTTEVTDDEDDSDDDGTMAKPVNPWGSWDD